MRWVVALLALLVAASPVATSPARADTDHAAEVDPFIGTGGHGHTFPGAVTPFGMVQLSPDTRIDGSWDGCSGYHYSDSFIYGFSHTHLSGTGCSDWGDVMLMPYMGDTPKWQPAEYGSKFSHKREQASPGYYQVTLDDDAIDVELTVTPRVGFHRYTFKRAGRANVILDLNHRDKLLDGEITILSESPTRITGYRRSEAWAKDQLVCFAIEFSKPMTGATFRKPDWATAGPQGMHGDVACNFTFDVTKGEELLVKVALSPVRPENARANLEAELPHWDFDIIRKGARDLWNRELSKIEIDGG
ncbi:MAG TPA: glycoside hydrolase domain-containing protein, partial [Candidatus Krumholzibacteria bacterium]|nr:glycoside hydrolase domain-containing protein [Candidatus Krumholzibacteria bacterium]